MKKRLISLLLVVVFLLSMLPSALAEDLEESSEPCEEAPIAEATNITNEPVAEAEEPAEVPVEALPAQPSEIPEVPAEEPAQEPEHDVTPAEDIEEEAEGDEGTEEESMDSKSELLATPTASFTRVSGPDLNENPYSTVSLSASEMAMCSFVPSKSGKYEFTVTSASGTDTYATLYYSNQTDIVTEDDDSGDGYHFRIVATLMAGETYYLGVRFLSNTTSGSISFKVISYSPPASGKAGFSATWSLSNNDKTLSISGSGSINSACQELAGYVEEIIIANGITKIESEAFSGFSQLKSVRMANSVTSIEDYAFSSCAKLTSIALSTSLTTLGQGVFSDCTALESIDLPSGISVIPPSTFNSCINLKSVSIPSSVTSIGDYAFLSCLSLKDVGLNSGLQAIGASSFSFCSSLRSIIIPSSITSIGYYAFNNCSSLTEVTLDRCTPSIGFDAFGGCPIQAFYYGGSLAEWQSISWSNYDYDWVGKVVEPEFHIEQEYVLLEKSDSVQMDVASGYTHPALFTWAVEPVNGTLAASIVSYGTYGLLIGITSGTSTVKVGAVVNGVYTWAYSRVDVTETDPVNHFSQVLLSTQKITSEVFSLNYATVDLIPDLEQNLLMSSNVIAQYPSLFPGSITIDNVRFSTYKNGAQADTLYKLHVVDDRTVEFIPHNLTMEDAESGKKLPGSLVVTLLVDINGHSYETAPLTITIKKTKPAVKLDPVKFNSYDAENVIPLHFTNGNVVSIYSADTSTIPPWLVLDITNQTVTLDPDMFFVSPLKAGKAALKIEVEGFALRQDITLSYSFVNNPPKVKAEKTVLTAHPGLDNVTYRYSVTPTEFGNAAKYPLKITRITETVGKSTFNCDFDCLPDSHLDAYYVYTLQGTLRLSASSSGIDSTGSIICYTSTLTADADNHTYKVYYTIGGKEFSFTIKCTSGNIKPTLTIKATGTINPALSKSFVSITPSFTNVNLDTLPYSALNTSGSLSFEKYRAKSKTSPEVCVDVSYAFIGFPDSDSNSIIVYCDDPTVLEQGYTYRCAAQYDADHDGSIDTESKPVPLSISWVDPAKMKTTISLKATGSMNLTANDAGIITLTSTIKNSYYQYPSSSDIKFYRLVSGSYILLSSVDNPFSCLPYSSTRYTVRDNGAHMINQGFKYYARMEADVNGDGFTEYSNYIPLSIKTSAVKITPSVNSISLLANDRYDSQTFSLVLPDTAPEINFVKLDAASSAFYSLRDNGGGSYTICYRNDADLSKAKSMTATLHVFLVGNNTATANAKVTLKINMVKAK